MESLTVQKCFAKAGFEHAVSDETTSDSSDDDDIPLLVQRLSKDLLGCDYEKLPGISQVREVPKQNK